MRTQVHAALSRNLPGSPSAAFDKVSGQAVGDAQLRLAWRGPRARLSHVVACHLSCAAQGVQTQIGTTPIPFTTYYREKYGLRPEHFPVTRDREPRALTLPLFPGITAEQQQKVVDTVLAAL